MHFMLAPLGPQHHDAAHHQRRGDGDRVEQVMVNQVSENHPQHHGRQECDQQVDGKALRIALGRQTGHHVEDLAAKLPDHRQNRTELNDDVERHGAFATKVEQIGDDNLVAGTGDRQKLRQPFYHAEYQRLCAVHKSILPQRSCSKTSLLVLLMVH